MDRSRDPMDPRTPARLKDVGSVSKVRVVVRVRPFLPKEVTEKNGDPKSCVSVLNRGQAGDRDEVSVYIKDPLSCRNECYLLDSFFGQEDDNVREIFEKEVNPFIPGIFQGCNATVFAYGATGSGKTYTMKGTEECPGLMPLAMSSFLSMCQKTGNLAEISYYEVYMDRCYDLLEVKAKEVAILEDHDGQIHLKGLSRVQINSISEFHEVFSSGIQRRKVAHTGLNDVSSRSHGVLVILVSSSCSSGTGSAIIGKMNLLDLAGNEDNRRTCNEGLRLQESAKINQSLFALSNVIYALNNDKPRVPYRESKLTRVLQDSLGGTSHALMVACLNPGEYQESVYTISLAARSRHITNYVLQTPKAESSKVKVDMEAKLRAWLESKGKINSAQRVGAGGSPYVGRTPGCLNSIKKSHCYSSVKADFTAEERSSRIRAKGLFKDEATINSQAENCNLTSENMTEERSAATDGHTSETILGLPGEPLNKEEKAIINGSVTCNKDLLKGEMKNSFDSPVRKALSPISLNVNHKPLENRILCDPKTPKTPFAGPTLANDSQTFDGYGAWSSSLKSSFVQQYISLLNTASREELMEVKGIGQKLAEYILEIRETSPLRTLTDLEKIGLSSKQVYNMFTQAARGALE